MNRRRLGWAVRPQYGVYARAMLLIGSVLTVITAVVTLWDIQGERRSLTEELEARVVELASTQAVSVSNSLWDLNRDSARLILQGLAQDPDFVAASVTNEIGRVFVEIGTTDTYDQPVVSTTADVVLEEGGERRTIGALSLTLSRARLLEAQRQALVDALILGLVQLVVVLTAVALVLRAVIRPLSTITQRMVGIAHGELDSPVPHVKREDPVGDVARAVATFRDVSAERMRAQEALRQAHDEMGERVRQRTEELRQAEALFHSVIAASPAEIFARDTQGYFLLVNRAWEKSQGMTGQEAVGKTTWEVLPKERAGEFMKQDQAVLDSGESLDEEVRLPFGDDSKVLHTIKFPLLGAHGQIIGVGGITSDVTEHRNVEERLRQAQKMEAVGQLTGGVAHDFNNLLAVIQGNAEILAFRVKEHAPLTEAILRAAARGAELTQRLLAFSRQQPLRPRSIDMNALVADMSDLLDRTLGETIQFESVAAPDLWTASADPGQIESALLNLAINARDAMPGGGKLTVECANAALDETYAVQNPEAKAGDYVVLAVSDTGTGMPAEVQARAFEPFFTTKDVGQGSGLGLSMVYGFVKQSGGHAAIYSEAGRGTTVKLYLPRARQAARREQMNRSEETLRGRGEAILVIEDDEDVRALAVTMLQGLGYKVVDVPAAAGARKLLADGERVDLVLSDVVLPGGISGPEFAEEARADHTALRFIFMSGYPAEAAKRNGFLGSDKVLLNKPFQRHQLAKALRDALG